MVKLPAYDGKGFSGNSFQDGLQGQSARDWECVARLKKHGADNQYMICMIYIYVLWYIMSTVLYWTFWIIWQKNLARCVQVEAVKVED